ncbi:Zinc finger C-x8-C-x5-C-x3-H type (and similar), putative [Angomonas deanei]|uniref:Zinc finger C-x8-C-x5-C-x3-H type (And similar), putative n=1 Tax=Angomonas deanei TaxID=59799 RepID=A0A7G2C465_9TRYP|nr:Zinc finger C-x8-C-x5-C-x3-H type (and similar), putative [Angomonas deanei]
MSSGFKTELCRNYASREGCGFDVECTSAHGPVELSFYTDRENIKKLDLALPEAVEAHKNRIAEAVAQETKRSLRKLGFPIAELDGDVYKSFLCKHWVTFNDCGTCEHPDGCAACDGAHGEAELYYYSNPTHRKLLQLDTDDGLEAHRKERRDVNLYDACAEVGEVMWSRSGRGGIDYPIIAVPLRLEVMGATSTNRGGVESTTLRLSDLLAPTGPNKVAEKEISLYKTVLCPARDVGCKAGHHCDQAHSLDQVSFYTQDMKKRIGLASAEDIQAHKESMVRSQKAYNCLFVVCVSLREETDHLLEQIPVRWEEETTGKAPIAVEKMVLPVTEEEMNSVANHFKTKLCDNYKRKGSCQYGFRCRFAHGEDDLRTFGQNQRDKITSESAVREFAHNAEMKAKGLIPDSAPATTIPPHAVIIIMQRVTITTII